MLYLLLSSTSVCIFPLIIYVSSNLLKSFKFACILCYLWYHYVYLRLICIFPLMITELNELKKLIITLLLVGILTGCSSSANTNTTSLDKAYTISQLSYKVSSAWEHKNTRSELLLPSRWKYVICIQLES
jgi:hypothetical protein